LDSIHQEELFGHDLALGPWHLYVMKDDGNFAGAHWFLCEVFKIRKKIFAPGNRHEDECTVFTGVFG
jgi:hypothetical protein